MGRLQAFGIKPKYSLAEVSFIFRATEEVVCAKVATGEITGQGWRDIINYVMRYPRETFELPAEKELKTIFDLLHHHHLHHHHVPDKIVSRIQTVGIKPKYSLSEVSFILGVSHETVRIKVITGEIVGRKIGGGKRAQSWNIHLPDLVNYLIKKKN